MSILTINFDKPCTHTNLIEAGFIKEGWGTPDGRFKNGKCRWNKDHWFYSKYIDDGIYTGVIWYFPKQFKGYVTSFNYYGKNPAGCVYITIDHNMSHSPEQDWYDTMQIKDMSDLDIAYLVIEKKMNELNK